MEAASRQGERALDCSPINWDSLQYIQYGSEVEMVADYFSIVPATLPGCNCSISPSALTYNASTSYGVHDRSCYENQSGAIVLV